MSSCRIDALLDLRAASVGDDDHGPLKGVRTETTERSAEPKRNRVSEKVVALR